MGARIIVDEAVSPARRPQIVDLVAAALQDRDDTDALVAVVTKLPSGRLTVFVNHVEDSDFIATLERALARLA